MTSEEQPKEFRRRDHVTMRMQMTPQQHAVFAQWSGMVPTLHFLDINVVNATRKPDVSPGENPRKAELVANLQELDQPHNAFSYLLALMEKVSDLRGTMSDADLQAHILEDLRALRAFFKRAGVVEEDEYAVRYLKELRGVAPETARSGYMAFLERMNDQFNLRDPVAPSLRLQRAKDILDVADAHSISRQHSVVLLTLGCLYGNPAAKRLMKFKANPAKFDAQNAIADVMAISRAAELKLQIEQKDSGFPWERARLITDDDGLRDVFDCFEPVGLKIVESADGADSEFKFSVNLERLLTGVPIQGQSDALAPKTGLDPDEYEQLQRLLMQPPKGAY